MLACSCPAIAASSTARVEMIHRPCAPGHQLTQIDKQRSGLPKKLQRLIEADAAQSKQMPLPTPPCSAPAAHLWPVTIGGDSEATTSPANRRQSSALAVRGNRYQRRL